MPLRRKEYQSRYLEPSAQSISRNFSSLSSKPYLRDRHDSAMATDVLGLLSAGLGIISFILGQTPDNSGSQTSVELTVGYVRNPDTHEMLGSPDGNFGHVYLFSPVNSQIGDKGIGGHHVDAGTSYSFKVDTTGEQPEYLEVTATNDAVCMSWMAVTYGSNVADGTYAWFGDFYQYCGLQGGEVSLLLLC